MATIVLKLRGRELSRHPVVSVVTRIGRDIINDVHIDNDGISRLHASIRYQGETFHVVDEGSVNGIFVNGETVDVAALHDGDEIQLGKFTAVFLAVGGSGPDELQAESEPVRRVNPVETTAISTRDIHRMMADRRAAAGMQSTSEMEKPPQPDPATPPPIASQAAPRSAREGASAPQDERSPRRYADTLVGPASYQDIARSRPSSSHLQPTTARDESTTKALVGAVTVMGVLLVALTGVVVYLLAMRG